MSLKQIALAKIEDITMLSARFRGEQVLFEPWLTLLIDAGTKALFLGVYRPSFDQEEDETQLPNLCWRRSEWIRDIDERQIGEATDRQAYLAGNTQIGSSIRFSRLDRQPALAALIQRGIAMFRSGVTVAADSRPDSTWNWLRAQATDDTIGCQIEYSPVLAQSAAIEAWAADWLQGFTSFDPAHAIEPDAEITVSFRHSLQELLAVVN